MSPKGQAASHARLHSVAEHQQGVLELVRALEHQQGVLELVHALVATIVQVPRLTRRQKSALSEMIVDGRKRGHIDEETADTAINVLTNAQRSDISGQRRASGSTTVEVEDHRNLSETDQKLSPIPADVAPLRAIEQTEQITFEQLLALIAEEKIPAFASQTDVRQAKTLYHGPPRAMVAGTARREHAPLPDAVITPEGYAAYPVSVVAARVGWSTKHVRELAEAGKVRAMKVGRNYVISFDDVLRYREAPKPRRGGRPRKTQQQI